MGPEKHDTSADFHKALESLSEYERASNSLYELHQKGCDVAYIVRFLWLYYEFRDGASELVDDFVSAKKYDQDLLAAASELRRMIAKGAESSESASIVGILEKQAPLSGLLDVWIQGLEAGQNRFKTMADRRSAPSGSMFLVFGIEHAIKQTGRPHYPDLANILEWIAGSRGKDFDADADALRKIYERHCNLPPESLLPRAAQVMSALLPELAPAPQLQELRSRLIAAITPKATGRK